MSKNGEKQLRSKEVGVTARGGYRFKENGGGGEATKEKS